MAEERCEIRLQPTARRQLASLPVPAQRRIGRAIDVLATNPRPRGSQLLSGTPSERIWRIRVGDYRVLYEIRDDQLNVLVIRLGHRREVYRGR
jgi:mRNA interferase RelE/StbE